MHTIELLGATVAASGADFTVRDAMGRSNEIRAATVKDAAAWVAAIEHNVDVAAQETASPRAQ